MAQFITVDDVNTALGSDWAAESDKATAVDQANTWLTAQGVPTGTTGDDRANVIRAGCILARMAASGSLYASSKGRIKRKSVEAKGVSSEVEYMDGSAPVSGDMEYVKALLGGLLSPFGGSVTLMRRL